jgi:hypothetical protein
LLNRDNSVGGAGKGGCPAAIAREARLTAFRMRGWAPHRQIFGSASNSASVGAGLAFSRAAMAMIMPGSQ